MKLYRTVKKEAESEQTIERSRFIAHVKPVETKEEADAFIAEIRKKYKDASHNVPAMVIGDKSQIQWGSDDGEPQGTSGAPIVQMLVSEGITNVCVVVTRYFGGIKLGTGGLVRAYTSSAKLGLEAAGICDVEEMMVLKYELDYSLLSKLQNIASGKMFFIKNIEYIDCIVVEIVVSLDSQREVRNMITNLASGRERLVSEEIQKIPV